MSTGCGPTSWFRVPVSRTIDHVTQPPQRGTVLVVASDPAVSDHVRRVAAAAGRTSVHVPGLPDRSAWQSADIVVVARAEADLAAAQQFPIHPRLAVVTDRPADVRSWQAAALLRTTRVLELPAAETDLMQFLTLRSHDSGGDGVVIAVTGGCGGAGASVFATALALVASRSGRALLVDGDVGGGGLDLVAGLDTSPGLRWPDLVIDGGNVTADALHHALPGIDDLAVLSTRRDVVNVITENALRAVVAAGRSAGDVVVCDTPRIDGVVQRGALDAADLVVLVAPATVRSAAAARVVADSVGSVCANVGLVVRGPAPGGLTAADVAEIVQVPLLASVRPERRLAAMLDGRGLSLGRRSSLAAAASAVLAILSGTGGPS